MERYSTLHNLLAGHHSSAPHRRTSCIVPAAEKPRMIRRTSRHHDDSVASTFGRNCQPYILDSCRWRKSISSRRMAGSGNDDVGLVMIWHFQARHYGFVAPSSQSLALVVGKLLSPMPGNLLPGRHPYFALLSARQELYETLKCHKASWLADDPAV